MAKSSLIAKLEALPKGRHGKSFLETLNAKQQQDFTEAVAWFLKQPKQPTRKLFAKALSDILGIEVSPYTIQRYITDGEYIDKQKAR